MADKVDFEKLRDAVIGLVADDFIADADTRTRRQLRRMVRDAELDVGRSGFRMCAPLVGHCSFSQRNDFGFYEKLSTTDNRGTKKFEYLNVAGSWG